MDTESKNSTKNVGNVSNSPRPTTSMSAEERLKRSMRNLSYTSGGLGNANTQSSNRGKPAIDASRKKVGGVVLDIETIEDANKQKFETRGRRNNVIILILCLLLVVSLVYLAIAIISYNNSKKPPNCIYEVEGDASAEWIIQGGSKSKFRISQGLGPDTVYLLDSTLNIKTDESVVLTIEIEVLLEGKPILIAGLHESHNNLTRVGQTNTFVYQGTITNGGKILLFKGIDFSEAPSNLTSDNVKIKVIANLNKV